MSKVYYLVNIEFDIVTSSWAHFGSGEVDVNSNTNNIVKTLKYIPASTLKGALRAKAKNLKNFQRLFGESDQQSSVLMLQNAYLENPTINIEKKVGIKIDPVTNTVEEGALYKTELIPIGTTFKAKIIAKKIQHSELEELQSLIMQVFDGSFDSAIGGGKSIGWGKIKADIFQAKALEESNLQQWYQNDQDIKDCFSEVQNLDSSSSLELNKAATILTKFTTQTPVLVNPTKEKVKIDNEERIFLKKGGQLLIEGKSIKSILKKHTNKILATIIHQNTNKSCSDSVSEAQNIISNFLGGELFASKLSFSDAIGKDTKPHKQTMIAVDRFSGGAKKGSMLTVEAATCSKIELEIKDMLDHENKAYLAILYFVIRDFMQCGFKIGWGTTRGFGHLKLESLTIKGKKYELNDLENLFDIETALPVLEKQINPEVKNA